MESQTDAANPASVHPERKTLIPRGMGILSIGLGMVGGGAALLSILGGLTAPLARSAAANVPHGAPNEAVTRACILAMATVWADVGVEGAALLVLSVPLVVIGVGQLRNRRWAARRSVHWGALSLVSLLPLTVYAVLVAFPGYRALIDAQMKMMAAMSGSLPLPSMPAAIEGLLAAFIALFPLPFLVPLPLAQVLLFRRPEVIVAMDTAAGRDRQVERV